MTESIKEGSYSNGISIGYLRAADYLKIHPNDLAMIIGEMFSMLHFRLKLMIAN